MARRTSRKFATISLGILVFSALWIVVHLSDSPETPLDSPRTSSEKFDSQFASKSGKDSRSKSVPVSETQQPRDGTAVSTTLAKGQPANSPEQDSGWKGISLDENRRLDSSPFRALFSSRVGDRVVLPLSPPVAAVVTMNHTHENGAKVLGFSLPDFVEATASLTIDIDDTLHGSLFSKRNPQVLRLTERRHTGNVFLSRIPTDRYICSRFDGKRLIAGLIPSPAASTGGSASASGSPSIPLLESLPGSPKVLYLDFDGETVVGSDWNSEINNGDPIVADPYVAPADIEEIWKSVSADYRPFNVNVTTDRSVFDSANTDYRCMVIFTPTASWYSDTAGGVAYTNSFGSSTTYMCWVFNDGVNGAAEAASHEAGHQLGLNHDGTSAKEYYEGHIHSGTGIGWGPIMGASYDQNIVQFSKGEYDNANNTEDDFQLIQDFLTLRTDEFGDTTAAASGPGEDSPGAINMTGVIETQGDKDVFRIETGATGAISLTLLTDAYTNLDAHLELLDSGGNVIDESNPANDFEASLYAAAQPSGVYYLRVEGVGLGTASSGYTDYGSVGEYVLSGGYTPVSGQSAPEAPGYLSATDGGSGTTITVTWSPSAGATGYTLYRATSNSTGSATLIADITGTVYDDSSGLSVGSTYYYFVKAYNNAGSSPFSASDSGYIDAAQPPLPPTGVAASDGEPELTISWNPVSNADVYWIWRSNTSDPYDAVTIDTTTDTYYVDVTASLDTVYYYWVDCENAYGYSPYLSNSDSGYRSDPVLDPPASISATDGAYSDRVTVSWPASTNATAYDIFRGPTASSGDAIYLATTSSLTYDDTSAALDTVVYYFVRAKNGSGFSDLSSGDSGYRTYPVPGIPTSVTATDGTVSSAVDISWSVSSDATGYYVYRATSDSSAAASQIGDTTTTTFSDTTALAATTYYYFIRAYNPSKVSAFSSSDSGHWDLPPPLPPGSVSATDGVFEDKVGIFWDSSANADGYRVYRAESDSSAAASHLGDVSVTSFADTSATPGVTYYYFVKSYRGATDSVFSASDSGYRRPPAPAAPTSISASDGSSTDYVRISWATVDFATEYKIYRSESSTPASGSLIATVNTTQYDDTTAVAGTVYYYFLEANNSTGSSSRSSGETGYRSISAPATPANLSASDGAYTDRVAVSWSSSTGATGYELFRSPTTSIGDASKIADITETNYNDASAAADTTYYYFVRAYNTGGSSSYSSYEAGHRLAAIPSPPTNLTAADGSSTTSVNLSWSASTGATNYQVYRADSDSFATAVLLDSTTGTTFSDSSATADTTYFYFVTASSSGGESSPSTSDSGYRNAPIPDAPTNLTAADGDSTSLVAISWSGSTGAVNYHIYRSESDSFAAASLLGDSGSATFSDSTAVADTTYFYFVTASSSGGESSPSASDSGYRNAPVPAAPSSISASDNTSSTSISIDWSASAGASGYRLYRSSTDSSASAVQIEDTSASAFEDTSADADTTYFYFVTAYSSGGESDFSGSDIGSRTAPKPATPTGLSASDGTSSLHVAVSWNATAGASGYLLYRSATANFGDAIEIQDTSGTSYQDTALEPDTTYYYFVAAYSSGGTSDPTGPESGYRNAPIPASPTGVSASDDISSSHISVSWNTVSGASSYKIYRSETSSSGDAVELTETPGTSYNDTGASADTTYYYFVKAHSSGGDSPFSSPDTGRRTAEIPAAPVSILASDGTSSTEISVSWSASSGAGGYRLYRGVSNVPAAAAKIADISGTAYDDSDVAADTTYYYFVSAYSSGGESAKSSPDSGFRNSALPATPSSISASDGTSPTEIGVTWSSSATATGYRLYRSSTSHFGDATQILETASTSYNDTSVDADTTYYYFVSAVNSGGESPPTSGDAGHRTSPIPNAPSSLSASDNASSEKIVVTWAASTGATGYRLYRNTTNTSSGASQIAETPGTSYDDTSATPDTTYYYFATAYSSGGESAYSPGDSGRRSSAIPDAPGSVTASDGTSTDHVAVSWATSAGADDYLLYRATVNNPSSSSLLTTTVSTSYNDVSASADVTYYYFVSARSSGGESAKSAGDGGFRAAPIPAAPASITASDGTSNEHVSITWPASSGTAGYRLVRSLTSSPEDGEEIADQPGTSFDDTTAEADVTYSYFVSAYSSGGPSAFSAGDLGYRNAAVPAVPTNLSASDGTSTDHVLISWDASSGASGYKLYRSSNAAGTDAVEIANTTAKTFLDETASYESVYYYFISAYSSGGPSSLSTAESGFRAPPAPEAPNSVTASDGTPSTHVAISWSASNWATGYRLLRSTSSDGTGAIELADSAALSFDDTSAEYDTTYYYLVVAYNNTGESAPSAAESGFRQTPAPSTPTSVTATDGESGSSVTISWDPVEFATGYYIYRNTSDTSTGADQIAFVEAATTYEDTTASPGVTYYYFVVASNATGDSGFSTGDSGLRSEPTGPSSPTGLTATQGTEPEAVELNWSLVTGATEYLIYRNTIDDFDTASLLGTTTDTAYRDTDLEADTTYYYFIVARNASGDSAPSPSVSGYAGPAIADDNYEENDTLIDSYSLLNMQGSWLTNLAGPGIAVDDDWFSLTLGSSETSIDVIVVPLSPPAALEVSLYDGDENEIAVGNLLPNGTILTCNDLNPGETYYIFIHPNLSDTISYDLLWKGLVPGEMGNRTDMTIGQKPYGQIGLRYYSTRGIGQTLKAKVKGRKPGKVFFKTSNEGTVPVNITSRGNFSDPYIDLKYVASGAGNVTAEMAIGKFKRTIPPLSEDTIKLKIKPTRAGALRRRKFIAYTTSTINNLEATEDTARFKYLAIPKKRR